MVACDTNTTPQETIPRYETVSIKAGSDMGSITVTIVAKDESTTIYYLLTSISSTSPTTSEVKAGTNYREQTVIKSGNATKTLTITLDELAEKTQYLVHVVLEENNTFSEVLTRKVLTKNKAESGLYGDGTEANPFQITTVEELAAITTEHYTNTSYYKLMNDLDLESAGYGENKNSWVPIGKQNGGNRKFAGVFDGNNHTIHNLYLLNENSGVDKWGLFLETSIGSMIKNLSLKNAFIKSQGFRIGGIVGYAKGNMENVQVLDSHIEQISGEGQVGSIVGAFYDTGSLVNAHSNSDVVGKSRRVGGLVGAATTNATFEVIKIEDVSFTGTVFADTGDARQIGGILGAGTGVIIKNAYVNADITGIRQVGGIAGFIEGKTSALGSSIKNSFYAGGTITSTQSTTAAKSAIGKILGEGSTSNAFYTCSALDNFSTTNVVVVTVALVANSSSFINGTDIDISVDYKTQLAWDFDTIWNIGSDNLPSLIFTRRFL